MAGARRVTSTIRRLPTRLPARQHHDHLYGNFYRFLRLYRYGYGDGQRQPAYGFRFGLPDDHLCRYQLHALLYGQRRWYALCNVQLDRRRVFCRNDGQPLGYTFGHHDLYPDGDRQL